MDIEEKVVECGIGTYSTQNEIQSCQWIRFIE